jgi:hypothetical protein
MGRALGTGLAPGRVIDPITYSGSRDTLVGSFIFHFSARTYLSIVIIITLCGAAVAVVGRPICFLRVIFIVLVTKSMLLACILL